MSHHIRKSSRKHTCLGIVTLLTIWLPSAEAATWYVATTGADGTSCGSSAAPCAKVNYVLDNKVNPGDTIRVKPGTYSNQGTISFDNTTMHDNATLTADDTANRPQFLNSTINVANGASGVTISYLRIRGASSPQDGYYGVVEVSEYPTTIANNEIWNGGQGVMIRTSQQVTVSNNDIHNLGLPNTDSDTMCVLVVNWQNDPIPNGYANAIRVTGNTLHDCGGDGLQENSFSEAGVQFNYLVIDNNKIYNNQEQGIDTKGTDDLRVYNNDIYSNGYGGISNNSVYGSTARWELYNNQIHDHTNFAIFNQGNGSAWKIWNNIIYNNNTAPQYNLPAVDLPGDSATLFYSNTVYNNRPYAGLNAHGNGNNVKNNIFWNNGINNGPSASPQGNIMSTGGTPSYNYVYPTSPGLLGTNAVTSSNPGFVNAPGFDFHLLSTSPNVNAGTALPSQQSADLAGVVRPQGGGWDIGAYELVVGAITLQPPSNLHVVP